VSELKFGIDSEIRTLVGMIFHTIFQRKSFSRWLNLSLQLRLGKGDRGGEDVMR
jgi:hypothetical protein